MAVYSDERRPTLANLIKFTLLINVVLFIILVLFWILRAGIEGGLTHTGTYATILLGLNAAAFLFYEQLFRPDDDGLRNIAEILGTLQVLCSCITILLILGTILLTVVPGLEGILPVSGGSQPVATSPVPDVTVSAAATQAAVKSTACYQTSTGCTPYPPTATIPPYGSPAMKDDPIIGSYTFDKTQFDPKTNYNSRAGNYEYGFEVVPLDYSPDIKWTFRDDGVLLFYDTTDGKLLRTGTWSKTTEGKLVPEYRIVRGNRDYRGSFKDDQFQITSPDIWRMEKAP